MSDLRKFINIVESMPEDISSQEKPSFKEKWAGNKLRMDVGLDILIKLANFIEEAKQASKHINKKALKITFIARADAFLSEVESVVNDVSGKEFTGLKKFDLVNYSDESDAKPVIRVTKSDYDPVFRKDNKFGKALYNEAAIQRVIDTVKNGINLIEFKSGDENKAGFLLMIQQYLMNNKEYLRLNNEAKALLPEVKSRLASIEQPN